MARKSLTDKSVAATKHGKLKEGQSRSVGGGLHYLDTEAGGKLWRLGYRYLGKQKTMALGAFPAVSLADARKARDHAKELLAKGIDPGEAKQTEKRVKLEVAAATFEVLAWEWFARDSEKRARTTAIKLEAWLKNDVFPYIGKLPISSIKPVLIRERVLDNLTNRGAFESAQRVRNMCSRIFTYAISKGLLEHDPAGALAGTLPSRNRKHLAAIIDPKEAGKLMRAIYGLEAHPITVAALKLSALAFVRPGEIRHAEWSEIDLEKATWIIPGAKMKMRVDHVVPLASQAVEALKSIQPYSGHARYVFTSLRTGERPMSENTVNSALRAMGIPKESHSAHGFRAMARTILDEVLGERVDLIEHQLAHAVKDPNGRAYNRTAHLPARRVMMQRWADYLDQIRIGAEVVPIHGAA